MLPVLALQEGTSHKEFELWLITAPFCCQLSVAEQLFVAEQHLQALSHSLNRVLTEPGLMLQEGAAL